MGLLYRYSESKHFATPFVNEFGVFILPLISVGLTKGQEMGSVRGMNEICM
jgi:hypothetical protein